MTVALQIRNVPDEVRDILLAQASQHGQSMQSFLLELVEREARLARHTQMFERTARQRTVIPGTLAPEQIVREGRDTGFDTDRDGGTASDDEPHRA